MRFSQGVFSAFAEQPSFDCSRGRPDAARNPPADIVGGMAQPPQNPWPATRDGRRAPAGGAGRAGVAAVGVIAVVALALAAWALWRSFAATDDPPGYTDAQRGAAKARVCAAYSQVRAGVNLNTNLQPPGGPGDATGALAVAANARVALSGGGQYLLTVLDPATPQPLSDTVRSFATTLLEIGAAATSGVTNTDPQQAARLSEADRLNTTIAGLCR
jgi:hypothetical protein